VQIEGRAFSIRRSALLRRFHGAGEFHDSVLRYYHCLVIQASQLGVCNNAHPVEQRFSRWLLMLQDRSGTSRLNLTQESIAGALGTRRATISVAAAALQDSKVISYTPGSIKINSRRQLQATTCPCYRFIKSHFDAA
jgi:CRP-like cAMP-binding protein